MTTNNRYKVWARNITYFCTYIEAKDGDEALTIAENMDGASFINTEHGDWEIYMVEEVNK